MLFRNRSQRELDRAVATATGEDLRTIRRLGFSVIDLHDHDFDPEPDLRAPQIVDWDELDRQRHSPLNDRSRTFSSIPV